jgi:hypothetical protein
MAYEPMKHKSTWKDNEPPQKKVPLAHGKILPSLSQNLATTQ